MTILKLCSVRKKLSTQTLISYTISSYQGVLSIFGVSLNRIKSISFDVHDDCGVISLANTTVLKQIELVITCDSANHKMLSAIRLSDNIETLKLDYGCFIKEWVADITKLLQYSKTLTQLAVTSHLTPQDDILQVAHSLIVNTSVRQFTFEDNDMGQKPTLKFLEQLKQACTVEEITLRVSCKVYYNYQFLGDVEKCVQQINHIRSTRGVSRLLKVEIGSVTLL